MLALSHFSGLLADSPLRIRATCWLPLGISLGCLLLACCPFAFLWVACRLPLRIRVACRLPLRISLGCLLAAPLHSGCLPACLGCLLLVVFGCAVFGSWLLPIGFADWLPLRMSLRRLPAAPSHFSGLPPLHFSGLLAGCPICISRGCLPAAPSYFSELLARCPFAFIWVACRLSHCISLSCLPLTFLWDACQLPLCVYLGCLPAAPLHFSGLLAVNISLGCLPAPPLRFRGLLASAPSHFSDCWPAAPSHFSVACLLPLRIYLGCSLAAHVSGLLASCPSHFSGLLAGSPFAFLCGACQLLGCPSHFLGCLPTAFAFLWAACMSRGRLLAAGLPLRIFLGCLPAAPSHVSGLLGCPFAFLWVACRLLHSHVSGLLASSPFAFLWAACWLPVRIRVDCWLALSHFSWLLIGCAFASGLRASCPFAFLWVAFWLHLRISLGCLPAAPSHFSGLLAGCSFAFLWVACWLCQLHHRISLGWLPRSHFSGLLASCPFKFLWSACQLPLRISLGGLAAAPSHFSGFLADSHFRILWVACGLPLRISGLLAGCPFTFLWGVCWLPLCISLGCVPASPSHFSWLLAGCPFACLWVACQLPLRMYMGRLFSGCPSDFSGLLVGCPFRSSLGCSLAAMLAGCPFASRLLAGCLFAFIWVDTRLPVRISLGCLPAAPSHFSGLLAGCLFAFRRWSPMFARYLRRTMDERLMSEIYCSHQLLKPVLLTYSRCPSQSFPCQSSSQARKRLGRKDSRGGKVLGKALDMIDSARPPLVVLENVRGFKAGQGGAYYRWWENRLLEIGYPRIKSQVLGTHCFGLPQKRERLYMAAFREDCSHMVDEFHFPVGNDLATPSASQFLKRRLAKRFVNKIRCGGRGSKDKHAWDMFPRAGGRGWYQLPLLDCKRLMGFPEDYKMPVARTHQFRRCQRR